MKLKDSPFWNVFLFSFFWALQIIVVKLGFNQGAKAITMIFQSAFIASVFLSIIILPKSFKKLKSIPRRVLIGLLIANAVHFGLGGFFSNSGIALTNAVNAGFLVKFALVTTTFLAWIFLNEKMTITKLSSVLVMLVGSYLISTKGQMIIPQTGDLLILIACLCWSAGNILVRKALKGTSVDADLVTFLRPVAGIPVLLFSLLLTPLYPTAVQNMFAVNLFDPTYFIYAVGSGILTALLWIYLNRTLKIATASYMTIMSMMTPVFVVVLALLLLKETILPIQITGAVLIIFAGLITHRSGVAKN